MRSRTPAVSLWKDQSLYICKKCRDYHTKRKHTKFPHGQSATEPLVPPSNDGSTPLTDALPRSIFLDPKTYKNKFKSRDKPPHKNKDTQISEFEKQIMNNPFARILGSGMREDRLARRLLPSALLIKFTVYNQPEAKRMWLLPTDLSPSTSVPSQTQVRGVYRQSTKLAIDELGSMRQQKKWNLLVPAWVSDNARKTFVWRDGMSDYILMVLRSEAWKRLDGLPRKYLFHATVDEDIGHAIVGENVGERIKSSNAADEKGEQSTVPTETTRQIDENSIPTGSNVGDISEKESTDSPPRISAILYLAPSDQNNWEFKPISIQNQSTQATLFNLRRLFPERAEYYLSRLTKSGNTIAVQSSEISSTILFQMLRLSLYLDGAVEATEFSKYQKKRETTKERPKSNDFVPDASAESKSGGSYGESESKNASAEIESVEIGDSDKTSVL